MELLELFASIEDTLLARFREASFVHHSGDRGENREHILREFLEKHLPARYGVIKGEVITVSGEHSYSADIIIYDAINCPVLYSEKTAILPVEGVYGIIEVKSTLPKKELVDAARKIESFKRMAQVGPSVIQTREYFTVQQPSRPFGIILSYSLSKNSLDSLIQNWEELNAEFAYVNYYVNYVCVLGEGILRYEKVNLTRGEKTSLMDTDDFVNLVETMHKKIRNNESMDEIIPRIVKEVSGSRTFGKFFVYLLILLSKMKLNVPDIGRYVDSELPMMIVRES